MKLSIGDHVEITASGFPHQGRTGVVRNINSLTRTIQVWCDDPDFLGRRLVRVTKASLRVLTP